MPMMVMLDTNTKQPAQEPENHPANHSVTPVMETGMT